jgi:hypothetical protein
MSESPMRVRSFARSLFVSSAACLLLVGFAPRAAAQSAYVGGAVLADITRASGTSGITDGRPGNGETIGAALRVGSPLGQRWGVELEFVRSGETEWRPDVTILAGISGGFADFIARDPSLLIYPTPEINVESRLSTLTTSVWWRQRVSDRFNLVYLGGVAFARTESETEVGYQQIALPGRGGMTLPTRFYEQESVSYDTGASVGLDGDIEMTEHLRLVPGVRMLTVASRWIVRPSVGLNWRF